jgi:hypothetical protein
LGVCVNTKVEKFGDGRMFAQNSVDLLFVLCRYEIVMMMMMMFLCPTIYSSIRMVMIKPHFMLQ